MEFNPLEFQEAQNKTVYLDFLHQHRERSAFYAAVQRITFPFRFVNVMEQGSSAPVKPSKTPNLMQRPLGPSIDPCPWLKVQKSRTGYPYFLWDVDGRCTIKVEDMETSPKYTCISHTWGRWRDISKPDIAVTGVPWLVPQNKRFKVEDLPDHLSDAFAGLYVWLDLFCIPQDRSERSLIEISRQASIFGNASVVIAWLNGITSWCGLRETIRWLSMFCLKNYTYLNTDQVFLPPDIDSRSTGLVLEQSNPIDPDYTSTPASWFTSLWTLQEACLRPDIILCNKDFEILTVGHNTLVTLEELAALLNYAIGDYGQSPYESVVNLEKIPQHMRDGSVLEFEDLNSSASGRQRRILEDLPKHSRGVLELFDSLVNSGMNNVYRLSPASILTLGHYRQCTSDRAEAIMSVIGATNWYKASIREGSTSATTSQLVMGYYPAEFLNEVAQKLEAPFFATVSSDLAPLESVTDIGAEGWAPRNSSLSVGSMLPFRSIQGHVLGPAHAYAEVQSHRSVRTWLICQNGSVKMEQVGILSPSTTISTTILQASVRVPGLFSTGIGEQCDLHEFIRTFRTDSSCSNFAISLYQQTKKFHAGIILKKIEKNKLVKIGTFVTDAVKVEEVDSTAVSWIVL